MLKKVTPIIFTLGLTHHIKGEKELIIIFQKILKEIPNSILLIGGWVGKKKPIINEVSNEKIENTKKKRFFLWIYKKRVIE